MKKGLSKVTWLVFVLLMITSLLLISCSSNTTTTAPATTQQTTSPTTSAPSTTAPKTTATTSPTTTATTSTPTMTPKSGGTLVISQRIPTGLGYPPKMTSNSDLDAAPICTDSLVRFDENKKPIPWLATSWEYSSDLKSLKLTLRKDVKFQDGTDFNAAAVKANLALSLAAKRGELASVSSIDVVDPYTVRLNLSKIDAFLIPNLAEFVGIMISPAALDKGEDWCRTNPVGTGPFKQVSYESGVSVKFEKWDGYWQKGKPYLDAVQIVFIADETTALAAFKKGEVNLMSISDPAIATNMKDASKVTSVPTNAYLSWDSAHQDSPFSDIKFRQAVAYALDINTLANSFGPGYWQATNQIVNKSSLYYNPDIIGYPYDLQKAKDVLAASGYPTGFKTNIIYGTSGGQQLYCTALQSMLSKIGIEVTLMPMTPAATVQLRIDGWQNALALEQNSSPDKEPGNYLQTTIAKDSGRYSVVARSAAYDDILSKLIAETDFNKRVALNQQLLKQMIDVDCMIGVLYQNASIYVKSPQLNDEHRGDIWLHQWLPQDAWFGK